jgi:hypothetical protein
MITIERDDYRPVFQGDILIMRVKKGTVPKEAHDLKTNIVAHSETGHHHTVSGATVLGGLDPMVMFLKADDTGAVKFDHLREFDTHESYEFLSEIGDEIVIKRQRERAPEGWRRVED